MMVTFSSAPGQLFTVCEKANSGRATGREYYLLSTASTGTLKIDCSVAVPLLHIQSPLKSRSSCTVPSACQLIDPLNKPDSKEVHQRSVLT